MTSAMGANDGSSWTDAFVDLQDALATALSGDEIWVAEGIYRPSEEEPPEDPFGKPTPPDPAISFHLIDDVALYGGFAGDETARDQRDWESYPTILSGDLDFDDSDSNGVITDTDGITGTNSYHVVAASGTITTAVLDGFIVTAGYASESGDDGRGAGVYLDNASPTLNHLLFSGNLAHGQGGGIYSSGHPTLMDVTFRGNSTEAEGGGMYNYEGHPELTHVAFNDNHAIGMGGGLFNFRGTITLTHAILTGNAADSTGGGLCNYEGSLTLSSAVLNGNAANSAGGLLNYMSDATLTNVTFFANTGTVHGGGILHQESGILILTNSILWQNSSQIANMVGATSTVSYSLVEGGCPAGSTCTHLLTANPEFVDADGSDGVSGTSDDDLRLSTSSPAVDAGDNAAVPAGIVTDLNGDPRFADVATVIDTGAGTSPLVDMGAYETQLDAEFIYLPLVLRE